jgi:hypothetical protein
VLRRATAARKPTTKSGTSGTRRAPNRPLRGLVPAAGGQRDDGDERAEHRHPHQLHEHGLAERGVPRGLRGGDDLADVVDTGTGPAAELGGTEPQRPLQKGKYGDRERPAERDQRDGGGRVPFVAVPHLSHGADGRRAADGVSGGDEQRLVTGQSQPPAEPPGPEECGRHDAEHHGDGGPAEAAYVVEGEPQAEEHDPGAHQPSPRVRQPRPGGPAYGRPQAGQVRRGDAEYDGGGEHRHTGQDPVDGPGEGDAEGRQRESSQPGSLGAGPGRCGGPVPQERHQQSAGRA